MPHVKHNKKSSKRPSKTQREYDTDEESGKDVEEAETVEEKGSETVEPKAKSKTKAKPKTKAKGKSKSKVSMSSSDDDHDRNGMKSITCKEIGSHIVHIIKYGNNNSFEIPSDHGLSESLNKNMLKILNEMFECKSSTCKIVGSDSRLIITFKFNNNKSFELYIQDHFKIDDTIYSLLEEMSK